jgi:hypothetical protein
MLNRAGRGHDPERVDKTGVGECALLRPPCLHPGMNMAEGWENAPAETQYVLHAFVYP